MWQWSIGDGQVIGHVSKMRGKERWREIEIERKRQNGSVSTMLPASRRPRALYTLRPSFHTPIWDQTAPALISHHFLSISLFLHLPISPLSVSNLSYYSFTSQVLSLIHPYFVSLSLFSFLIVFFISSLGSLCFFTIFHPICLFADFSLSKCWKFRFFVTANALFFYVECGVAIATHAMI